MEAIQCPNCGFGSCTQIDEEKWSCPACDNIFNVHNLSKEFKATDEHISAVHQDIIESIDNLEKLAGGKKLNEAGALEKAEAYLKNGDYIDALSLFSEVTQEYPTHYAGWYGKYKALTENFSKVDRYAVFLCGGIPLDVDKEDWEAGVSFLGSNDIRDALSCEDVDRDRIVHGVSVFLEKCAEYGKKKAEEAVVENKKLYRSVIAYRNNYIHMASTEKAKRIAKTLIPAVISMILFVAIICLMRIEEQGANVSVFGGLCVILLFILICYMLGERILRIFNKWTIKTNSEGKKYDKDLSEVLEIPISNMTTKSNAIEKCCNDIDNYNYIVNAVRMNPSRYIEEYISNPLEKMIRPNPSNDNSSFIIDFLSGKIERFNYLSGLPKNAFKPDNSGVVLTSAIAFATPVGFLAALLKGDKKASFYLNQALIFHICSLPLWIIFFFLLWNYFWDWFTFIWFMIMTIITGAGIGYACMQNYKEFLPVVGKFRILWSEESSDERNNTINNKDLIANENVKTCPICGAHIDDDALFCAKCGKKIG